MRIGFDARLVYYQQAGIGQYIIHLVQGLARVADLFQALPELEAAL